MEDSIQIKSQNNIAFIDGQNLHMGTAKRAIGSWRIDLARFRVYLEKKYDVTQAFYFLGYIQNANQELYTEIREAGFELNFRQHNSAMIGVKKGNVDSDIIFHVMKKLYRHEDFRKVVLVSGDGDYKLLVDFLIEENRFEKIMFPDSKRRSSLYKELSNKYLVHLDDIDVREKIEKKKRVP